jgi:hypothetical protein
MTSRRRWRRRRRILRARLGDVIDAIGEDGRRLAIVMVGIVVVLALAVTMWEAFRAVDSIREAERTADRLTEDIVKGDVDSAHVTLEKLDESTSRAANSTNGPIWWLGAQIPFLGRNVEAVRTAAREIDQVTDEALPGIVDVADKIRLETFRPKGGRLDLAAVAEAAPAIARADRIFAVANRDIAAFDADGLIGPLQNPMLLLQEKFHNTSSATGAANEATKLIPTMLAADGKKRVYLLLIMNNAEIRSLSGMPGSIAEITSRAGKMKMEEQGGIQEVLPLKKPPVELTKAESRVFPSSVATDIRDTAAVPHFPRAAELAAAVVGKRWKEKYDGVIAVDPVAMGYMLAGLGPVDLGDGQRLTSSNAVATLLNGVYVKYPTNPAKQDEVFETAAKRIFDAMVDGQGDSVSVVRALVRGVAERRIMLWSRDKVEQDRIQRGFLSGSLETGSDRPQVGMFVNDGAGGKMEYYLAMSTRVRSEQCFDDDAQELKVTTTLLNNAPGNASRLPLSVTGRGDAVPRGHMLLHAMIFGPREGDITSITVDGQRAPTGGAKYLRRPVANVARQLAPGRSSVIVTRMRTPEFSPGDPELRDTPGVRPNTDDVTPSACDD